MQKHYDLVRYDPVLNIIMRESTLLEQARHALHAVMPTREFEVVSPLIEQETYLNRAAVYDIVRLAYMRGYSFYSARTLADVKHIYAKYVIVYGGGQA